MEKQAGVIVVLSKNGEQGIKIPLKTNTPCSFGLSMSATVRMNVNNTNLRDIHCIVNVDSKGFAVLVNKSLLHPVVLNGRAIVNEKVLINNDIFEVCGSKFQYVNSRMTEEKAKLYKKEIVFLPTRTPLKLRASESAALEKPVDTPENTPKNVLKKKQTTSTIKPSKKATPKGTKSAAKPKSVYSPMQTRRSLFNKLLPLSKITTDSPIIPASRKNSSLQQENFTSTPEQVLPVPAKTSSTASSIKSKKGVTSRESSLADFLKDESLCKSTKKSAKADKLRRFVTVRSLRGKPVNLSFDSSSTDEQTPSKRNVSNSETTLTNELENSSENSKRRSVRLSKTKISKRVSTRRVRAKSVPGEIKAKSLKKRYTVHAVSIVSDKTQPDKDDDEELDVTTPVMSHNISKKCMSAPRIHHIRKSRLDDDVNESLHMDDSTSETPVIHDTSRRSLAKRSTAKLQESLRLISPEIEAEEKSTSIRQSGEEIFTTPLKTRDGNNTLKNGTSSGKLRNMKVSITSTPKESVPPTRGVKRKLSTTLEEINPRDVKIFKKDDSPQELVDSIKNNSTISLNFSDKSQNDVLIEDGSLLESTVASSIVYETTLSKIKTRSPLSEKKQLQKTPSNSENIEKPEVKTPKSDVSDISGIGALSNGSPESNEEKEKQNSAKKLKTPKLQKSPENDLRNVIGVKKLRQTPKVVKSPKNDLSDVRGVKQLMQTPKQVKSPKNDLTNVYGVKRIMQTPKEIKSPKNDLSDVRGVKQLMKTPKQAKSPENDLTNVYGVRKIMQTPKVIKSPKNDLSDVRGVKQLMQTPKEMKSPKNDLTDVRGVKQLLQTPKEVKSPENDLTNVYGVRRIMETPREVKSPKNDLSDVYGVRKLMQTPKEIKSPINDLSNVSGIDKLLQTPKQIKTPENDLSNVYGVQQILQTPKQVKSPKNDLTDVYGVKNLMQTPKAVKSPKNDLSDVSGVKEMFEREEDAFDRLIQKKKVITYKGKASKSEKSPVNVVEDLESPLKPDVEEWVSQQIVSTENMQADESNKTRVTRKRQTPDYLEPVVIITKRNTRRNNQKDEDSVSNADVTPAKIRRKAESEMESSRTTRQSKKVEENVDKEKFAVVDEKLPKRTTRRKQINMENQEKGTETPMEIINNKRKRTRNQKQIEDSVEQTPVRENTRTRSRKQDTTKEETQEEDADELMEQTAGTVELTNNKNKETRSRKHNATKEAGKQNEDVNENMEQIAETSVKLFDNKNKKSNGRKAAQTQNRDDDEHMEESDEAPMKLPNNKNKKARSRRQDSTNEAEKQKEDVDKNKKETAEVELADNKSKRIRGRKETEKRNKDVDEHMEKTAETSVELSDNKNKGTRSRKYDAFKEAGKQNEDINEHKAQAAEASMELPNKNKRTRGRKEIEKQKDVDEIKEQTATSIDLPDNKNKRTRSRKQDTTKEAEKQKEDVDEHKEQTAEVSMELLDNKNKRTRGRGVNKDNKNDNDLSIQNNYTQVKRTRSRKHEDSEVLKEINDSESNTQKRTRSRKGIETQIENSVPDATKQIARKKVKTTVEEQPLRRSARNK